MRALAEYSAEALAHGFWRSLWLLARGMGWFLEGNVLSRIVHIRSTMQIRNAGALGGCATHTANEKIQSMGPMRTMVSLALPPPSRLTKRR